MPNNNVDVNGAAEKPVSDQHITDSQNSGWRDPLEGSNIVQRHTVYDGKSVDQNPVWMQSDDGGKTTIESGWMNVSGEAHKAAEDGLRIIWDRNNLFQGYFEWKELDGEKALRIYGHFTDWEMAQIKRSIESAVSVRKHRAEKAAVTDRALTSVSRERDIVARAKKVYGSGLVRFPNITYKKSGDGVIPVPKDTAMNKWTLLDVLFGLDRKAAKSDEHMYDAAARKFHKCAADPVRPHLDEFRGRVVDQEGNIMDDHYPFVDWVHAFEAANLTGMTAKTAGEAIRAWALENKWNDLTESVNDRLAAVQWDEKSRMKEKLIDLFELRNTPLTRNVGQYFWLSLYNRVMNPGCIAPIAIALIGAQGCGKSLFAKRLCQIITGNEGSDSVQLNLGGKWIDFLRAITGQSVIATVGEMAGFKTADINLIKDITTRTSDPMDHKYEGNFHQQRQWIMMLDGNKYELQRDETGNRRFMPLFCGQVDDVGGQPRWRQDFEAIFDDEERGICFEDDVWQIFAECRDWMAENGKEGYETFVREIVRQVKDFNAGEVAAERGIVVDGDIETYLDLALSKVKLEEVQMRDGSGKTCVRVDRVELLDVIHGLSNGRAKIHPSGLRKAMAARGAEEVKPMGVPKYRFAKLKDKDAFDKRLSDRNPSVDDEGSVKSVEQQF
ncbi:VapE domain-containing protein [Paraburkholderia azotifigens]|uniref:VapE domain-containing protein n=1 Tax=Paraburkholderia azotifigens TaxID=2057004 RepID=UPI0031817A60